MDLSIAPQLHSYKTLEYSSRVKESGRSKSNSLNPQRSNYPQSAYQKFIPDSYSSNRLTQEFKRYSDQNEILWKRFVSSQISHEAIPQYSSHRSQSPNDWEDRDPVYNSNALKSNIQQSNEKPKITQEERYEGSLNSWEDAIDYSDNGEDSSNENQETEHLNLDNDEDSNWQDMPLKLQAHQL